MKKLLKPLLWILIVSMIAVFSLVGCKPSVAEEEEEFGVKALIIEQKWIG